MRRMEISAYELAQRFVGIKEVNGPTANPQILSMLRLDSSWPGDDDVAWCSAFVNYVAWMLRLPRSKKLNARSWLFVGEVVSFEIAEPGFDVVILSRGEGEQPGPNVLNAPGHVGFYGGREISQNDVSSINILVLGGNQGNTVSVARYPLSRVLGIRRLI